MNKAQGASNRSGGFVVAAVFMGLPFVMSGVGPSAWADQTGGTLLVRVEVIESCDVDLDQSGTWQSHCGTAPLVESFAVNPLAPAEGDQLSVRETSAETQTVTITY